MALEKKALEKLKDLFNMSQSNFEEMSARWDDLKPKSKLFSKKDSNDFLVGYVFGKIEHKFISWFYAEYGRSQTDEEYVEFSNIVNEEIQNEFALFSFSRN